VSAGRVEHDKQNLICHGIEQDGAAI